MQVNDNLRLVPIVLANFAANGAIGTAAATVDVASVFVVLQTTSNVTLTIPAPTSGAIGVVTFVINTGTATLTVENCGIPPNKTAKFIFGGASWAGAALNGADFPSLTDATGVKINNTGTISNGAAALKGYLEVYSPNIALDARAQIWLAGDVNYANGAGLVELNSTTNTMLLANTDSTGSTKFSSVALAGTSAATAASTFAVNGLPYLSANSSAQIRLDRLKYGVNQSAAAGTAAAQATQAVGVNSVGDMFVTNGLSSMDSRAVLYQPQNRNAGLYADFKQNTTDGLSDGGTFHGVMTFRPYGLAGDTTGGVANIQQIATTDNGNLWTRSATGAAAWGAWKKLAFASAFTPKMTQVFQGQAGPLPLTGATFTTTGGTLVITASGSGYGVTGTKIGMNINLDGVLQGVAKITANLTSVHMAFVPTQIVLVGVAAGSHTISLTSISGTTTDINDNFSVTVQEMSY